MQTKSEQGYLVFSVVIAGLMLAVSFGIKLAVTLGFEVGFWRDRALPHVSLAPGYIDDASGLNATRIQEVWDIPADPTKEQGRPVGGDGDSHEARSLRTQKSLQDIQDLIDKLAAVTQLLRHPGRKSDGAPVP